MPTPTPTCPSPALHPQALMEDISALRSQLASKSSECAP